MLLGSSSTSAGASLAPTPEVPWKLRLVTGVGASFHGGVVAVGDAPATVDARPSPGLALARWWLLLLLWWCRFCCRRRRRSSLSARPLLLTDDEPLPSSMLPTLALWSRAPLDRPCRWSVRRLLLSPVSG